MKRYAQAIFLSLIAIPTFCLAQTKSNMPDLRPVLMSGTQVLKTRIDEQYLYFSVKNSGKSNADASMAQFTYYLADGKKQVINVSTPALNVGQEIELRVSPNTCPSVPSSGDCRYDVKLDAKKVITESNETNNSASGVRQG